MDREIEKRIKYTGINNPNDYYIKDKIKVGARFRRFRLRKKLSQEDVVKVLDTGKYKKNGSKMIMTIANFANYETGRSEPSIRILKQLSKLYGVSVDQLIGNVSSKDDVLNHLTAEEEEACVRYEYSLPTEIDKKILILKRMRARKKK